MERGQQQAMDRAFPSFGMLAGKDTPDRPMKALLAGAALLALAVGLLFVPLFERVQRVGELALRDGVLTLDVPRRLGTVPTGTLMRLRIRTAGGDLATLEASVAGRNPDQPDRLRIDLPTGKGGAGSADFDLLDAELLLGRQSAVSRLLEMSR